MSIDHYIYVTPEPNAPQGRVYSRVIIADIIEEVNRKGGADYGDNTVYVMQGSIEYLYGYADPTHAQADFEEWRRQPLENIRLRVNGVVHPRGRMPLLCGCCGKQIPEGHVHVQVDDEDTNSDAWNSYCDDCYKTPLE
jgi:hypothetical protein